MARSRGQLVLVAGLGIAVTLVLLAVVLNTVIFTQNLATREGVSSREPIGFAGAADEGTGGLISEANFWNAQSYDALNDQLAADVETWSANASLLSASRSEVTHVRLVSTTNGTRILQPYNQTWTDASGDTAWTMATDVTGTRRFRMNVTRDSLYNTGNLLAVDELFGSKVFRVNVTDGTNTWGLYLYRSDSSTVVVETVRPDGTTTSCTVSRDHVVVDATEGFVNGTDCEFTWAKGVSTPYDVSVKHGDRAQARYVLFVDRPQSPLLNDLPPDTYHDRHEGSPYTAPAIYSARVDVTFRQADVNYSTVLTVEPERPPGGETYSMGEIQARELVYVNATTGYLSSISPSGDVTTYDVQNPEAIGPMNADLDGDGLKEIPYVNGTNYLKLVDANNQTQTLAAGAQVDGALIGVGKWRGNLSVFYVNKSDNKNIWRVAPGEAPSLVTDSEGGSSDIPSNSVGGIADFNGDGDKDLVYLGSSSTVHYVDGGQEHSTGTTANSRSGFAHGFGAPRVFTKAGGDRAPFVDGSSFPALVAWDGTVTRITDEDKAYKVPVAGVNFDSASGLELAYVGSTDGKLRYVTQAGNVYVIQGPNGSIQADPDVGVA